MPAQPFAPGARSTRSPGSTISCVTLRAVPLFTPGLEYWAGAAILQFRRRRVAQRRLAPSLSRVLGVFSMLAFSLFELHTCVSSRICSAKRKASASICTLGDSRGISGPAVISLYNVYSLAFLNAAIWPDLHLSGIPEFVKPWKYYFHAVMYSLILFLAAVVGERKKSAAKSQPKRMRRSRRK